jgi:hypothetical protein
MEIAASTRKATEIAILGAIGAIRDPPIVVIIEDIRPTSPNPSSSRLAIDTDHKMISIANLNN